MVYLVPIPDTCHVSKCGTDHGTGRWFRCPGVCKAGSGSLGVFLYSPQWQLVSVYLEHATRDDTVEGLLHDQMTVGVLGRECHGGVHDGLVFDGGQPAQSGLPSAPVVGPLDPGGGTSRLRGNDGDAELFSGASPLTVQDVLLQ